MRLDITAIQALPTGSRATPTTSGLLLAAITASATAVITIAPVTMRADPIRARTRGMTNAPATAPIPTIPRSSP